MGMLKSGFTKEERIQIRKELFDFVKNQSESYKKAEEAIVQEIRYWQQSVKHWGTTPSKSEKQKSFIHHNQVFSECRGIIESLDQATFHHKERGIKGLHSPDNMIPLHKNLGCHEKLHKAPPGSFTSGSMKAK